MKRLLIVVLLVLAAIVAWLVISHHPNAPQFKSILSFQTPSYETLHYNFLQERPFEGGKMWLSLWGGTNHLGWYLYDIDQRKVIGELQGAWPAFPGRDHSQVFCSTAEKYTPLIPRIVGLFRSVSIRSDYIETFWLLDVPRNSATRLGALRYSEGASSFATPSPDFRFVFNRITPPPQRGPTACLFDLERKSSKLLRIDGWTLGWWDNENLLFQDQTNDFRLFNVLSGRTSVLLYGTNVLAFLGRQGIDHKGTLSMFPSWNGHENMFYLTDTYQRWLAAECFLVKVERPDARLTLLSPNFKFEWSDHFDHSQRYYVYTGREPGQRSDGVFLRDLGTETETTLVTPNGERYFSVPNFYADSVIYVRRKKELWRTDMNGSNQIRSFPPAE
jgi:hypothetical protein